VDVFKNTPTGTPVHTFTGDSNNGTGLYVVDAGGLSDFLFVDQVPAARKPTATPGAPNDNGIRVQATGSPSTPGHLKIEAEDIDHRIRITESTSSSATVEVKDLLGNLAHSRFGAGVNQLTIQTHPDGGADVRVATIEPQPSTPIELPGLHSSTSLRIESLGTDDTITLGGANDASVYATVHTGAGNNKVFLYQDGDADGATTAVIDFDPTLGGGLGAGHWLQLGDGDKAGLNCTATLARLPGTAEHAVTLDLIQMLHGAVFGTNADTPARVFIENVTRLGEARLFQDSFTAINQDPVVFVEAPLTVERTQATSGTVYLGGQMDFEHSSASSTVHKFDVSTTKPEPFPFDLIPWEDSRGVVNVNSGSPAGANLTVQVDSRLATMNIPGNGKFTFQPRDSVHFPQDDPRSFLFKTLLMGSTPTGKFDLTNNSMVVDYTGTSPYDYLRQLMSSAHASDAWTGNGLGSSEAASATVNRNDGIGYAEATEIFSTFPATFLGRGEVDDTSVLLRYTLYGDTNLDGRVNLVDFNKLAANFGTGTRWDQGDSTYDGTVNLQDFNRLAANFGLSINPGEGDGGGESFGDGGEPHYTYDELFEMLVELNPEDF
jgi:hypothetical protein